MEERNILELGQTLLRPSGSKKDPNRKHLFVILTSPTLDQEIQKLCVMSVSISTLYAGAPYDPSCVLIEKEHPWIQRRSFISYYHTTIDPVEEVFAKLQQNI